MHGIAAAASRCFYRYEVTESDPPDNPAGDLPAPISTDLKASATGALHVGSLPPRSVSIFHAASDADGRPVLPLWSCARERTQLRWESTGQASHTYVRVLREGRHYWSTAEPGLALEGGSVGGSFAVQAVDRFGVASAAVECQ